MAFSDDEDEESVLQVVSNYYFEDENDDTVSFSELPIQWSENETTGGTKKQMFLRGTTDNGLQRVYKPVKAWKFDISNFHTPEILVLTTGNVWVKLEKPRKASEPVYRTILITVHCLHFVRTNPDLSERSLWDQLRKTFSLYETKPSENDLIDHVELITEAVKRDGCLSKSKILLMFLEEKPRKRKRTDKDFQAPSMAGFIVDDIDVDGMMDGAEEQKASEEDFDLFDTVCAFCDNGGELLICDGKCLRSFHATKEAGDESFCDSLGFTQKEVDAIPTFLCKNCKYQQHQCFACGKLGSSDKSSNAEVFRCVSANCGKFYHPHCVARLLNTGDEVTAEVHAKKIVAGEMFTCPLHKCCVCKRGENKKVLEQQFAMCRRCPKSYHRECLPKEIAFEDTKQVTARAWDGLLECRILIYCLDHEIIDEIGTPARDHIKFPVIEKKIVDVKKNARKASDSGMCKDKFGGRNKSLALEGARKASDSGMFKDKFGGRNKGLALEGSSQGNVSSHGKVNLEKAEQLGSAVKESLTARKIEEVISGPGSRKMKTVGSEKHLKVNANSVSMKVDKSYASSVSMEEDKHCTNSVSKKGVLGTRLKNKTVAVRPSGEKVLSIKKLSSNIPTLDASSERRVLALMEQSASSISLEDIIRKHKFPSTHAYSMKGVLDKTITLGKIEGSIEAVRAAVKKLDDGCGIEDVKAVCEPEILSQLLKWQNKLKVYLAPFICGMRYTSFGRHFTKMEKLKQIVDRLHWYVQDGDMIVDFCCGANDFSLLMKAKLEETGKKCSFKNYDIIQPKNDFNFELRDWMTVRLKELPKGSQLIMGLNPPFGVDSALANKFIDKALEFCPKLLILIVPRGTERLDKKKSRYELVWEVDRFSDGLSFYLPGSTDVNNKQLDQWNKNPPPLYLWSRPDFAAKHKAIAIKHVHLFSEQMNLHPVINRYQTSLSDQPLQSQGFCNEVSLSRDDHMQNRELEKSVHRIAAKVSPYTGSSSNNDHRENQDSHGHVKNQSDVISRKRKFVEEEGGRGRDQKSIACKKSSRRAPGEIQNEGHHRSPSHAMHGRSSLKTLPDTHDHMKNQSGEISSQKKFVEKKGGRGRDKKLYADEQSGRRVPVGEIHDEMAHHSPFSAMDDRSLMESRWVSIAHVKNQSDEKRRFVDEKAGRGIDKKSLADERSGRSVHVTNMHSEMSRQSPSNVMDDKSSKENVPKGSVERTSYAGIGENNSQCIEHVMPRSRMQGGTLYGDTRTSFVGGMGSSRSINNNEPCSMGAHSTLGGANLNFTGHMRDGVDSLGYIPYTAGDGERPTKMPSQVPFFGQRSDAYDRSYSCRNNPGYGHNPDASAERYSLVNDPGYGQNPDASAQRYSLWIDPGYMHNHDASAQRYSLWNDPDYMHNHDAPAQRCSFRNDPGYMLNLDASAQQYHFGNDPGYGHMGSAAQSSYWTNMSAAQGYTPCFDGLNYTNMRTSGSQPPVVSRNSLFDPRAPQPGHRYESTGFPPGP